MSPECECEAARSHLRAYRGRDRWIERGGDGGVVKPICNTNSTPVLPTTHSSPLSLSPTTHVHTHITPHPPTTHSPPLSPSPSTHVHTHTHTHTHTPSQRYSRKGSLGPDAIEH